MIVIGLKYRPHVAKKFWKAQWPKNHLLKTKLWTVPELVYWPIVTIQLKNIGIKHTYNSWKETVPVRSNYEK
jgi:hypothetical protein